MSEAPDAVLPRKRRRSVAQEAKTEATRRRLLEATASVIGEQGFGKTTIDAITARADVGHGAFYLHFASRQDAFDQVLTVLGNDLVESIGASIKDAHDIAEIERRGLQANLAFSSSHPGMHRVMSEAELFAPEAYKAFMGSLRNRYVRSLRRSRDAGQLIGFRDDELETLAVLLMGLRRALIHAYCLDGATVRSPPPEVVETLLAFVVRGLVPSPKDAAENV